MCSKVSGVMPRTTFAAGVLLGLVPGVLFLTWCVFLRFKGSAFKASCSVNC